MNRAGETVQTAKNFLGTALRARPVRQGIKDGLVALSLANLCLVSSWFNLLSDADLGYFNKLPVTRVTLLALAANFAWFALATWMVMRALRGFQNRLLHLAAHLLFLALLLVPLDFCRMNFFQIPDFQVVAFLKQPGVTVALLLILAGIVWKHRWAARMAAVGVGIMSPLALFTLGRVVLLCLGLTSLQQHAGDPPMPPASQFPAGQARVVWIIFDEADQRLGFERRPATLKMPAFDRLQSESVCAVNAYPPADSTFVSMPALVSGRRVLSASIKNASDLRITLADTGEVTTWSELPSVFSAARDLGINTALVGWYHPYARALGVGLNYCAWHPHPSFEQARAPTLRVAMRRQVWSMAGTLYSRRLYVDMCRASLAESLSVVTNATYGLVFLHLPPPHRPGIYLPEEGRFTIFGMPKTAGYFNNLSLADLWLGKLRAGMESCGQWDKTWLIVSADHSWRDSGLYDGRRDLRIPFILKPAGGGQRVIFSPRMNTVLTHDLVLAILRGEIVDQRSAVAWLEAHRSEQPPVTAPTPFD